MNTSLTTSPRQREEDLLQFTPVESASNTQFYTPRSPVSFSPSIFNRNSNSASSTSSRRSGSLSPRSLGRLSPKGTYADLEGLVPINEGYVSPRIGVRLSPRSGRSSPIGVRLSPRGERLSPRGERPASPRATQRAPTVAFSEEERRSPSRSNLNGEVNSVQVNKVAELIDREYSPRNINSLLGEMLKAGIIEQLPAGTNQQLANYLAQIVVAERNLLSARFPNLVKLIDVANRRPTVSPVGYQQAYDYLMTLPLKDIRDAVASTSSPSSPYRPGRSKDSGSRALLTNLMEGNINNLSPVAAKAYDILTGRQVHVTPTRMGTPSRTKQMTYQQQGLPPPPARTPGRITPPRYQTQAYEASPARYEASPARHEASPARYEASPARYEASPVYQQPVYQQQSARYEASPVYQQPVYQQQSARHEASPVYQQQSARHEASPVYQQQSARHEASPVYQQPAYQAYKLPPPPRRK